MSRQTEQNDAENFESRIERALGVEKRLRYKTLHRNQDRDLLRKTWPVQDHNRRAISVEDAPPNVRKKFQKAVKVNLPYWKEVIYEMSAADGNPDSLRRLAEQVRKSVNATIPKLNGKRVSDATEMFRLSTSDMTTFLYDAVTTASDYVSVYFFVVLISIKLHFKNSEFKMCIEDCNELLHLLPPLSDQVPIPHPYEIEVLYYRAKAQSKLLNHRAALEDAECCGAAIRLITYIGDDKAKQEIEIPLKKVAELAIGTAVELKLQSNVPRPLFSTTEINYIEKRWGVGIFHPKLYCCHHCGISRAETRLILCSGCNRAWVCGEECHAHGWKKHKTCCKQISRKSPKPLPTEVYEAIINSIEKYGQKVVWSFDSECSFSFYCLDPVSGKLFDAWYDYEIYIDDKSQKDEDETISEALSSVTLN